MHTYSVATHKHDGNHIPYIHVHQCCIQNLSRGGYKHGNPNFWEGKTNTKYYRVYGSGGETWAGGGDTPGPPPPPPSV